MSKCTRGKRSMRTKKYGGGGGGDSNVVRWTFPQALSDDVRENRKSVKKKASLTAVVFDWVESTQILRNFNSQLKQTTIPASEKLSNICTWFNPNRGSDTLRLIIVWQANDRILEVRFSVTATNSTDKVKLDDFNRKPLSLNHSQNSLSWSWVLNYVL